ncbi:sugar ABC transporter substrate-binding protein [Gluconacetobacter azotocaptans]|nr:sugar ABC transporter substrate-binding protein [Gluconacetobacter azotocaptans]GBQ30191.1 sugar ABC transporter substrate-binding periplasmic protein [Gluconacetobacter azotocaptans DSM 13594]
MQTAALGASLAVLGNVRRAAAQEASHPRFRFVFVNHVTTNPFFTATQYGLRDAAALVGADTQWTGSQNSIAAEMISAINSAIAAKASAIAVSLVDPHAFNDPVERALAAGIPVFAYNADVPAGSGNKRLAYIGQDLFKAGQMMGRRILDLVPGGRVALMIATPGQLNIQPRIDGARDVLDKSGRSYQIDVVATGATVNEELSKVKAYYLGHQDVKGMFSVDGGTTQSVAETMEQYGLAAKGVHGGGFDLLPRTLSLIQGGHLDFTIDQQPYLQGYYTVMEMHNYLMSGGLVGPAEINTGLKFVTKANVAPYLATKSRFEGSSSEAQFIPRSGPIQS